MIKLKNISKYYSKNQIVSMGLRKVNLELGLNEFVAIVGESGSGKTTLLNVISGIDSYEDGEMYINEEETSYYSNEDWENYRKKYIAFIFQNYNLIESYTVLQNVEAALILSGYPKEKRRDRALEIIERVGLIKHIKHKATKLSGGQKQRVVIARAIAKDAPVIVADEPTGNLDSESAENIIKLLAEIAKDKLVIVVTHDFNQVKEHASRRIRIFDGEIVEDKKIEKINAKSLPNLEDKDYQMNFLETMKMVARNLFATPKKSLLLFVIFLFVTGFFAFTYGSYSLTLTNQGGHSTTFRYVSEERLVVRKADFSAFSDSEIESFSNNAKTQIVLPYDYILDTDISWVMDNIYLYSSALLPVSMLGSEHQNIADDEVIISVPEWYLEESQNEDLVGDTISLNNYEGIFSYEVVELLDFDEQAAKIDAYYDSFVFVSEDTWNEIGKIIGFNRYSNFQAEYTNPSTDKIVTINQDRFYQLYFSLNEDLADDEINIQRTMIDLATLPPSNDLEMDLKFDTLYEIYEYEDLTVNIVTDTDKNIELNSLIYNQIFKPDEIFQISILTNDGIDASNYYDELSNEKNGGEFVYDVIYPYKADTSNDLQGILLLIINFGLFIFYGFIFLIVFFISYVIIKNIINSKLNDYAIFRTIGANKITIRNFIYFENIFVAAAAYIIFSAFIIFGNPYFNQGSMFYVLKFFGFGKMLTLFIIVIVFSALISRRYITRIYHDTVSETFRREME
ncbi:MAG: ABC transporter ATP-binding protein/permease [Candidatus Izimaplasma sp.]|nr:ABC transporter ATP-binding protein/permease [Candidatus Izimaplasma bacterium]